MGPNTPLPNTPPSPYEFRVQRGVCYQRRLAEGRFVVWEVVAAVFLEP